MDKDGIVASFEEFVAECKKAREGEFAVSNGGYALPEDSPQMGVIGIVFYREDPVTKKEYYHPVRIRHQLLLDGEWGKKVLDVFTKFDHELMNLFREFVRTL